jgi:hypothetical protein
MVVALSTRVRCVVGTNSWMITSSADDREESWWYTGTNLVWRFETPKSWEKRKLSRLSSNLAEYETRTMEFDGDMRGGGVNALYLTPQVKIAWLAFCSGPFLKREKREVPMPSELWKETWLWWEHAAEAVGFKDQTLLFEDELGLPKSIDIFARNKQPLMEYRIRHDAGPRLTTTNVLGWEVPLEFYLAQYMPGRATNTWQVYLTAKAKTTSVTIGKQPQMVLGNTQGPDQRYVVQTAPAGYTLVSNPPWLNKARIAMKKRSNDSGRAVFAVSNDEPEEILVWNVRVQVASAGKGTDGFGWDTVYSDYPDLNGGALGIGKSSELTVQPPDGDRWRVCLLYSRRSDSEAKNYNGTYEVISEEYLVP